MNEEEDGQIIEKGKEKGFVLKKRRADDNSNSKKWKKEKGTKQGKRENKNKHIFDYNVMPRPSNFYGNTQNPSLQQQSMNYTSNPSSFFSALQNNYYFSSPLQQTSAASQQFQASSSQTLPNQYLSYSPGSSSLLSTYSFPSYAPQPNQPSSSSSSSSLLYPSFSPLANQSQTNTPSSFSYTSSSLIGATNVIVIVSKLTIVIENWNIISNIKHK
jgi:hypothetical protein